MPPLTIVDKIKVPDCAGGWYWYKPPEGKWVTVWVEPATGSWPATVTISFCTTDVRFAPGEWGPQFVPHD